MGNSNTKIYKNVDINEFDKCYDSPKVIDNKKNENNYMKINKKKIKNDKYLNINTI